MIIKSLYCTNNYFSTSFFWNLKDCEKQTAYQLKLFTCDQNCIYDSGKIFSSKVRHDVVETLPSCQNITAKLSVWNNNSSATKIKRFRASLSTDSTRAKWITSSDSPTPLQGGNPATCFYNTFILDCLDDVYLHVSGLGLHCVFINGVRLKNSVLEPAFTNYNKHIIFSQINLTPYLLKGENRIEIYVGDGWYNQNAKDAWRFHQATWRGEHKLFCAIEQQGNILIESDTTWKCSTDGPITRSALRLGETWDLRKTPSYSNQAILTSSPNGKLVSNPMHSITACEILSPKSITKIGNDYLCDFGRNISGYISIKVPTHVGQTLTFIYGEKLKDNQIDNSSLNIYIKDDNVQYYQTDTCICKDEESYFQPAFVYHGFQYVMIKGLEQPLKSHEVFAHFVRTAFPQTGKLTVSDKRLNTIQKMCIDSSKSNFLGFPTDCPHREKNGWTGDFQLAIDQYLYNFDAEQDIVKWLVDIEDCQLPNGAVPCIAPTDVNIFGYAWGTGPAWDVAIFQIVWHLCNYKNATYLVARFFPMLQKYHNYIQSKAENNLVEFGLGDWYPPKDCPIIETPLRLTDSCYYLLMTEYMSEFSKILGIKDNYYSLLAKKIRKSIYTNYAKDKESLSSYSPTALSALLFFSILPKEEQPYCYNLLLERLEKDKYTMKFGIFGVKYIFNLLGKHNRIDIIKKLLHNNKYPSFGNWIKNGAVTMWEDYEGRNSRNHYMFSDVSAVFYRYIAGVYYKYKDNIEQVTLSTLACKYVSSSSAKIQLSNGTLYFKWKKRKNLLYISYKIPANVKAILVYPNGDKYFCKEGSETRCINI